MRLIDENEAYEVLTEYYHHKTKTQHEALKDALSRVPTVEPKRGKWLPNEDDAAGCGYFICSCCENDVYDTTDFCPNCGARMEE